MRRPATFATRLFATLAIVWADSRVDIACAQPTAAATTFAQRMPVRGVSKKTGLVVGVTDDGLGMGQFGYRKLNFNISSSTPSLGDTQITVRVFLSNWSRSPLSVEVDGVLPDGQTSTTVVLRIPQTTEWALMWWDVWIDGSHDPYLSVDADQPRQLVDDGQSRWRNSQMLLLHATYAGKPSRNTRQQPFASRVVHGELSDNWLDHTPYDAIAIDLDLLETTAASRPDQFAALESWVRAGGNLWIENVGENWDRLRAIHSHFEWPEVDSIDPMKPEGNEPPGVGGWSLVNLTPRNPNPARDGLVRDFDPALGPQQLLRPSPSAAAYANGWFVVRRHGWGTVGAFRSAIGAQPPNLGNARRSAATAFWGDRSWPVRHGLVPGTANRDFSNWLIPGVGLAPVVSFQVLITLFVLAIGPLNYWLLKRAGRLHLMVITVPTAALGITLMLLAYGVLSDGLTTRVRAQSITLLDQNTGKAATWNRLSYYAAFAPKRGLTFTDDTAVYAIQPGSIESYDVHLNLPQRDMLWADGQQQLVRGWLASRTPTQYLTVRPRQTAAMLEIECNETGGTVANRFAAGADLIVVVDADGQWRMAENVPSDGEADLRLVEYPIVASAVRERLADQSPQFPAAFAAAEDSPLLYDQQRQMRRRYRRQNLDYAYVGASQSLLQDRWDELLGFGGTGAVELPANSYLMICETAPIPFSEDDLPVEDSSVHLVVGTW